MYSPSHPSLMILMMAINDDVDDDDDDGELENGSWCDKKT